MLQKFSKDFEVIENAKILSFEKDWYKLSGNVCV